MGFLDIITRCIFKFVRFKFWDSRENHKTKRFTDVRNLSYI